MLLDALSYFLMAFGSFLCITGALGIVRFPDFYTRMHAASLTDSVGRGFILLGFVLQTLDSVVIVSKLLLILAFIWLTSPTASHALAKSALHGKLKPISAKDLQS